MPTPCLRHRGDTAMSFLGLLPVIGLALLTASAPADTLTNQKISGPFMADVGGVATIDDFQVSRDNSRVVYRDDQDVWELHELYSVPSGGGTPTKISGALGTYQEVRDFQISPDSARVVFRVQNLSPFSPEDDALYSVPIGGGTPVQLNDPPAPGGFGLDSYLISADSARVIYRSEQDTAGVPELYSVPILGGTATKLNAALVSGGIVEYDFRSSPDSSRVVYRADQDVDDDTELYSVPIAGGLATRLNDTLTTDGSRGDVGQFSISEDSSRVVYLADQDSDEVFEVYSVPLTGGSVSKLNAPLVADGDCQDFEISPNSSRVVYRADQVADEVFELFGVPLAGGAVTQLNGALVFGGSCVEYDISADSSRVVYLADQNTDEVPEIFSVALTGGAVTQLNATPVAGGALEAFEISADSSTVVYWGDQNVDEIVELFSVPIAGGGATKISGSPVPGVYVGEVAISPDSSRVVFESDRSTTEDLTNLYCVPIGGGPLVQLNEPLLGGDGDAVFQWRIGWDSSAVYFLGDLTLMFRSDLYAVTIGGGANTRLNSDPATAGILGDYLVSPNSDRVVYSAAQDSFFSLDLYSVPIGGGTSVRLNPPFPFFGAVLTHMISPDGNRVVYASVEGFSSPAEVFSVPIDGGTAVRLNDTYTTGGSVLPFNDDILITQDSGRVVYLADQDTFEVYEVYSVPIGGGTVTKLNAPYTPGGGYVDYTYIALSPDSSRVVYQTDQDTLDIPELYSVPVAGGPVTKLNDTLTTDGLGGQTFGFWISPDSNWVVYDADQEEDDIYELYSVPLAGGTVTKLNGPLAFGGFVSEEYSISPDSARVVYSADQDTFGVVDLYSVPIGGGTTAKLNDTLELRGSSDPEFHISPDSTRVVFLAAEFPWSPTELFSVPIGGGTATRLNDALTTGGEVATGHVAITPDSSYVLYVADQDEDEVFELYSVPLAGGSVVKLNSALAFDVDVTEFRVRPDSSRVAYQAGEYGVQSFEWFSVPVGGGTPTPLNGTIYPGSDGADGDGQFSPDSKFFVYDALQDSPTVYELYSSEYQIVPPSSVGDWAIY